MKKLLLIILILFTINNIQAQVFIQTEQCDSYIAPYGDTLTTTGLYNGSMNGTIYTVDLTINQSDTSYTNVTACDSFIWNGTTYNQSGTYLTGGGASLIAGYDYMGSSGGHYYYLSHTYSNWTDADSICNANGGHLATISNQTENDLIYNQIPMASNSNNYNAWIGLYQNTNSPSYSEPAGGWEWVTGEPLIFLNWGSMAHSPGMLNWMTVENYAEITGGGVWNDRRVETLLRHVLEITSSYIYLTTVNGCDSTAVLNLTINNCTIGCTDSTAANYDPNANITDSSCIYCDLSISSLVINNPSGSCNGSIFVTSLQSSNMPATYSWSNGSISPYVMGLCSGFLTLTITDSAGCTVDTTLLIGNTAVSGCTDPAASNYNPNATIDDGSCIPVVATCTSPAPTGAYTSELIHDRVRINWDDMNDANCMVDQYRIRYRELGTSAWSSKTMTGSGLCLFGVAATSKVIVGLTPSTTYEYYMKAWYCGGTTSGWSALQNFTTADICLNVDNFGVSTPSTTKATFTWDLPATAYSFVRIKLRVDTVGSVWTTAGGFGVFYPAVTKNKNGLAPGVTYRASVRTWCNANGGPYRSAAWSTPIFWTQPASIRLEGSTSINNLEIYPNPSRDIFNVSFTSVNKQDLRVRIMNVIGEEIINENLEQFIGEYTKQIDLTNNAKGIYFLEIETNDGIINKKLILQ